MTAPDYDIVVIGAGIHGAGVAQAAATAGFRVLVLEQTAPAAGTSSRSSKLIHGGLRYLETARLRLVRESLAERELLLRLAPGLVRRVPFHIPVYRSTRRRPWQITTGLSLYAALAGFRQHAGFSRIARCDWDRLDGLATDGLDAVFRYTDAQTDDTLLTRAVLASARELSAAFLCPARFETARREANGYRVRFTQGGSTHEVRAFAIVNCAGPWANEILSRIEPQPVAVEVELVQGAHIVVDTPLASGAYYVESPRDGRAVFCVPWRGGTLVGTTETAFHGDPAQVRASQAEVEYLVETLRHYFPHASGAARESFAGLRVLPSSGSRHFHRSRETRLYVDDPASPRLVTVYGGKLTTYRRTALKALARLRHALPRARRQADTAEITLTPP